MRKMIVMCCIASLAAMMASCNESGTSDATALFPGCPQPVQQPEPGKAVRLMVPMRDCVRLATNVILPEGEGPWPVIVIRTPYGRSQSDFQPLPGVGHILFAANGYAVVEQDTRGRFESEGEFIPYLVERADTEDTLDWIVRQPWYNGKLGVWGLSYLGLTAELAMVARPELVDAAFVGEIRSDFYAAAFEHGNVRADTIGLWLLGVLEKHELSFSTEEEQETAMLQFPLLEGDRRVIGENIDFIDDFAQHLTNDAFWTADLNPDLLAASEIPIFMFDGWFDLFAGGMLEDWANLTARRGERDLFITVGPWTHLMGFVEQDYPFPEGGTIANFMADMLAFFDHYLKDEGTFSPARARYYDGGAGMWREDDELFPAAATTWRLHADLATTTPTCGGGAHRLSDAAPAGEATTRFVYDPLDPVTFISSNILDLYGRDGVKVDNDWCTRDDVVMFETDPLTAAVEVAGRITAHLDVASNAPDTSFLVRLSVVDSDGAAYNLREGAMLLSHREGDDRRVSYTPGETVHLAIPLTRLRWTFQPGQRLRMVVTSSGYPFIAPYPNTGGDDWLSAADPVTAVQTIVTGGGVSGSGLELDVLR
ncbi:MAG: CocE/NonD family hydrolase [Candidatus Dadabacteria bacterium]|nr:MAG: CocE/NonD family hydrolase [Candidatus Dadabacteria bacterium]